MDKRELMIVTDEASAKTLTPEEFCQLCDISMDILQSMIEFDIVHESRVFYVSDLRRVKTALRLQRDLEVNLAGAVLVLELLEQLDELRAKANILKRHYEK